MGLGYGAVLGFGLVFTLALFYALFFFRIVPKYFQVSSARLASEHVTSGIMW